MAKNKKIWWIHPPKGMGKPKRAWLSKRMKGAKGASIWLFRILADPKP
jgi:hypothetical protein